jgi:hypothetical protein
MQGIWYGDRRDRVKWGALIYWAQHNINVIAQVAFLRNSAGLTLELSSIPGAPIPVHGAVLQYFSNLERITQLQGQGVPTIRVFTMPWTEPRNAYLQSVVEWLAQLPPGAKLVFLDPDTGIAPPGGAGLQHVTQAEITTLWNNLIAGDWLAVYQHAAHNTDWLEERRRAFCTACGVESCQSIRCRPAADMAIFAAAKVV